MPLEGAKPPVGRRVPVWAAARAEKATRTTAETFILNVVVVFVVVVVEAALMIAKLAEADPKTSVVVDKDERVDNECEWMW